jgi:hypothetical protein
MAIEKQASTQLTTITSFLAGFVFASFTLLITTAHQGLLFQAVFVVTALTMSVLVAASIIGALLTIASEKRKRTGQLSKIEIFWIVLIVAGIVLFLADIGLLAFLVNNLMGAICTLLAVGTALTVIGTWWRISSALEDV